jgi:carbohydrate-selective porin OprB
VGFDGNLFANDETAQFLNGALVNNPSVPFPDNGPGLMLYTEPAPGWYASLGVADADADARETGLNTTFDGDTDLFYVVETGVVPMIEGDNGRLRGSYRVGVWHLRQQRAELDGTGTDDHDTGIYLSADQMVWRENANDEQGLGLFGRLGWADDDVNAVKTFVSTGFQYRGIIPGRDNDVLGAGYAYGRLSNDAGFGTNHEGAVEVYYNAEITPWLDISPNIQRITNPGGSSTSGATVAALRLQVSF